MAKFQINYNNGKGKIGKILIDFEPEQNDFNYFNDLNNLYDALEEKDFTILEIYNDLTLGYRNLENGKLYRLKDDGSGLEQRRYFLY